MAKERLAALKAKATAPKEMESSSQEYRTKSKAKQEVTTHAVSPLNCALTLLFAL